MGFIKTGFKELSLSLKNNFLQRKSLKQTNRQKKQKRQNTTKENKRRKKKQNTLQKLLPQRSHGISILSVSFYFDAFSVILRNGLFRLRFDRIIMSHQTVGLISLLHV